MRTTKYTFWQDGKFFIGFLNDYSDYETQGFSKEELLDNLKVCSKILNRKKFLLSEKSKS